MKELGIRDPPHLRPSTTPPRDTADPIYKDPIFEERMAQHQRSEDLDRNGRRSTVNSGNYKSQRKSKIDPRHGSKYGFSTTSFGQRNYSTSLVSEGAVKTWATSGLVLGMDGVGESFDAITANGQVVAMSSYDNIVDEVDASRFVAF